jgi:NAD(P)-dependent dehydrogenase (short-subunit alcohol dehydrogenase family)
VQSIIPLPGDVTSQFSLKQIAGTIASETGHINLLVANAGTTGPTLEALKPRATLADFVAQAWAVPAKEFNAVYGLNCTAAFYTILAFLPLLDAGNKARNFCPGVKSQVIATASTAAFLRNPRAGFAYTSSKAAVISMIKSFSSFCVPWGIRFNALAPGCK